MRKLIVGKSIDVEQSLCNWCGEGRICAVASKQTVHHYYNEEGEFKAEAKDPHICRGCAKQISEQLKEDK